MFPHFNPIIVPIFELRVIFGVSELPAVHKLSVRVKGHLALLSHQHYIVLLVALVPFGHNLKMCERQRMMK